MENHMDVVDGRLQMLDGDDPISIGVGDKVKLSINIGRGDVLIDSTVVRNLKRALVFQGMVTALDSESITLKGFKPMVLKDIEEIGIWA